MSSALLQAQLAMARGSYHAALPHFETALGEDPNNAAAHAKLSTCLALMNRRYGALREAERALQLDPEAPASHVACAFALFRLGDTAEARRSLDRAMALDPHDPDALTLRCMIALGERNPKALRQAAEELLARHPWADDAKAYLSRAASMEGHGAEAERLAREALSEDPEDANNHVAIGVAFLVQGKYAKAKEAAFSALSLASNNRAALELLALAKLRAAPLTGWIHWLNVKFMLMSETSQVLWVVSFLAINFAGGEIFQHYEMRTADNVLNVAVWSTYGLVGVSYLITSNALKRDLDHVRLRTAY